MDHQCESTLLINAMQPLLSLSLHLKLQQLNYKARSFPSCILKQGSSDRGADLGGPQMLVVNCIQNLSEIGILRIKPQYFPRFIGIFYFRYPSLSILSHPPARVSARLFFLDAPSRFPLRNRSSFAFSLSNGRSPATPVP